VWWHDLQRWFLHYTGTGDTSGTWYAFWSGFGSDMGEVTLVGGMIALYRKHNCHSRWCPRLGRHDYTDATGLVHLLCRRHHPLHPGRPLTARHITRIHAASQGGADVGQEHP
jgi:hypothetical protein